MKKKRSKLLDKEYTMKLKSWFVKDFLPILISVLLTGLMTIGITYHIQKNEDEEELNYIAYETYFDLINLRYKVEAFNQNVSPSDEFLALDLIHSKLPSSERLKLIGILDKQEVNRLMGIYTQGEALDAIMMQYSQAMLQDNQRLITSLKKLYCNAMKHPLVTGDLEEWDTILKKLSDYLKIKNIAE